MNDELVVLNQEIAICDQQLETINATLSMANQIRELCEQGRSTEYILEYIQTTLKVGKSTKESILKNIQELHKAIGIHHLKRHNDWPELGLDKWKG